MENENQCNILQKLEEYAVAMQSLVKDHGQQDKGSEREIMEEDEKGRPICDSKSCANSASVLAIAGHIENIRKITNERNQNHLQHIRSSTSVLQYPVGQPDDSSGYSNDSCVKALSNSLVLATIMKHLEAQDLLKTRLVAKLWKEEATIRLLSIPHHKYYKVTFAYDDTEQKFLHDLGSLEEFSESYYNNKNPHEKFPCSSFYFRNLPPSMKMNNAVDLSNFLSAHGHHIKSLTLGMIHNSPSAFQVIRKIIFDLTPCLEFLYIDFPWCGEPSATISNIVNPPTLSLNCLKELRLRNPYESFKFVPPQECRMLVRDILSAAPNLNRVSDPCLGFTYEINSTGKVRAIQKLTGIGVPIMITRFSYLSTLGVQLTILKLESSCFSQRFLSSPYNLPIGLQRILESSSKTLKTLKIHGRLDLYSEIGQMGVPIMEKMENLQLHTWDEFPQKKREGILPPGYSIKESFPRLKTLKIEGIEDYSDRDGDNPFGCVSNSSTTVERLSIISDGINLNWLEQARSSYRNVRNLSLNLPGEYFDELPDICRTIWKHWNDSQLEELNIVFKDDDSNSALGKYFAEKMDATLTGFDRETCRMLRKQRDLKNCLVDQNLKFEVKRDISILDVRRLKVFQLSIQKLAGGFPLFSQISVIHALEPMIRGKDFKMVINGVSLADMIKDGPNVDFWGVLYDIKDE